MAHRPVVLVVDDNKPTRDLIGQYLADQGADVVDASDGDQAIALLEQHKFDLVLLDILMPNRDGFEVLRWATQRDCSVPIVAISQERAGSTQMSYAAMATSMGAVKGVDKPITPGKVADMMKLIDDSAEASPVTESYGPPRY